MRKRSKGDPLSLPEKKNVPKELNKFHSKLITAVVTTEINKTVIIEMRGKWGS